jgi:hypothetical protein
MPLTNKTQKREACQRRFIARVAREASSNARENALSHGRSVTIQQGEAIVKVHPDGRTDIIRKIEKSSVIPEKRLYHL